MTCSICSGSGWRPDAVEGEQVFHLCECRTKGKPIPFPQACRPLDTGTRLDHTGIMCPRHRAEWDADATIEA